MKKEQLLKNIFQWGTLAAIVAMALPDAALAASIGTSITNFTSLDVAKAPPLVNAIAYVGGAALGIRGALKLKAHAENPAQEKIAPGIASLLAGGGLAALPVLIGTAFQTLHMTGNITFQTIDSIKLQ